MRRPVFGRRIDLTHDRGHEKERASQAVRQGNLQVHGFAGILDHPLIDHLIRFECQQQGPFYRALDANPGKRPGSIGLLVQGEGQLFRTIRRHGPVRGQGIACVKFDLRFCLGRDIFNHETIPSGLRTVEHKPILRPVIVDFKRIDIVHCLFHGLPDGSVIDRSKYGFIFDPCQVHSHGPGMGQFILSCEPHPVHRKRLVGFDQIAAGKGQSQMKVNFVQHSDAVVRHGTPAGLCDGRAEVQRIEALL